MSFYESFLFILKTGSFGSVLWQQDDRSSLNFNTLKSQDLILTEFSMRSVHCESKGNWATKCP